MVIPSITTLILGLAITALLSLVDWYVWRRVPARTDALESRGTRQNCAEQDAVDFQNFQKVAQPQFPRTEGPRVLHAAAANAHWRSCNHGTCT